jgi:hypothetical protein
VRARLAIVAVAAACSGRDARTAEERGVKQPTRLEVIAPPAPVSGLDVAISPVDANVWATRDGLYVFVHDGKAPRDFEWADHGRGLSFSRDGAWLHAGIQTYDPATGRYRDRLVDRDATYTQGLDHSPPGYSEERSAICFEPAVRVVSVNWHAPSRKGPQGAPRGLPGIRLLALDDKLRLVADLLAGETPSWVEALACSKRWVVAAAPRMIVWDRANGYRRATPPDVELPHAMTAAIEPHDRVIAFAGTSMAPAGQVALLDPATSQIVARVDSGVATIDALAFSADGTRLAVGGDGRVAVLHVDSTTLTPLAHADIPSAVITALAFEPDGNALRAMPGGYRLVLR